MKHIFSRLLFLFGFIIFILKSYGQEVAQPNITGSFSGLKFEQFIQEIELRTSYRFYYNPSIFDSVIVNLSINEKPLDVVLEAVFRNTDFRYAIDSRNHVYLTKGRTLQTELPIGFFSREESTIVSTSEVINEHREKEKLKTSPENKLYEIGTRNSNSKSGKANLAGHIKDVDTGEPVIGAVIYIENPWTGIATDQFGYYSLTIPKGSHQLKIKSIGMKNTKRNILLHSDGKLNIELKIDIVPLKEILIEAEKDVNVSGMQMGLEKLDIKTMKQVPTAMGETDILKVILTLPGVKSAGESATGLNVRGGATSQNLILYNDAPIYNPSHLFGFFSAFNPDVLKNVELYKSGIPAKYGGRISSVLEVSTREGNKKKFAGAGGIGLITGRLTLEGPIIKDKTSFIIGGRSTYSNWLLKNIRNSNFNKSSASFYDLNLNISHEINDKNSLYLSGYLSNDKFKLNTDTVYSYYNQNAALKWKHIINNKLYGVLTGGYSKYGYSVSSDRNPLDASKLSFNISQSNIQADFSYFPTSKHTLDFGVSSIYYKLFPGSYQPTGTESLIIADDMQSEQALESALHISDRFDISPRLSVYAGLRYSLFNYLGPKDVYQYPDGLSKEENNIRDTLSYKSGDFIKTYHGPEYRLSARYILSSTSSIKISYNKLRQYIHMISNTAAISPTDIWKLSDPNIKPEVGDQVSLGLYKNIKSNTIETSVEAYYKTMENFLDYKGGAKLLLNHHIETDVLNAHGKAYGVELMVKKLAGKLNGWVSYTYSRSLLQVNNQQTLEIINKGKYYPSNYDKPHDFTFIGNYKFSRRFSVSLNMTYSTGRPITLPLGKYDLGGTKRIYYSERNQYRIPDYYRADVAMNIEGNHKIKKLAHSSWTIAIYNMTGRRNAYSVYFRSEGNSIKGYKLSIFGQPIPTITYNFKF